MTRKDYMAGKVSHSDYYGQFSTPEVADYVVARIGADRLRSSSDEHLNDIPLHLWDRLSPPIDYKSLTVSNRSTEANPRTTGTSYSLCDVVCISKEAARKFLNR